MECVCHVVYTGTGNVADDMQNQIKANGLRIRILEEENAKLQVTVGKMLLKTGPVGGVRNVSAVVDTRDGVREPQDMFNHDAAGGDGTVPVQLWKYNATNTNSRSIELLI